MPDFCSECTKSERGVASHDYRQLHYGSYKKNVKKITKCTYKKTKEQHHCQWWIQCNTCADPSNKGRCLWCAKERGCIKGNHGSSDHKYVINFSPFFCDIGAKFYKPPDQSTCTYPDCKEKTFRKCCRAPDFCENHYHKRYRYHTHNYQYLQIENFVTVLNSIKECTFSQTGEGYRAQWWIQCKTCKDASNQGGCLWCRKECYKDDHDYMICYSGFYCDVGCSKACANPNCTNASVSKYACNVPNFCKDCSKTEKYSYDSDYKVIQSGSYKEELSKIKSCTCPDGYYNPVNQWYIRCKTCSERSIKCSDKVDNACLHCRKKCVENEHNIENFYGAITCGSAILRKRKKDDTIKLEKHTKCSNPHCSAKMETGCKCYAPNFCSSCENSEQGYCDHPAFPILHVMSFKKTVESGKINRCTRKENNGKRTSQWWITCKTCGQKPGCLWCMRECINNYHSYNIFYTPYNCHGWNDLDKGDESSNEEECGNNEDDNSE